MSVKICILTTVHPPFYIRIFHKEAKRLVKFGYDVTLIAQNHRNEVVDRIKIIALPKPKKSLYAYPWSYLAGFLSGFTSAC